MSKTVRCFIVLIISPLFFFYSVWGLWQTHSWGVMSDGLHTLGDALPFGMQWWVFVSAGSSHREMVMKRAINRYNLWFLALTAVVMFGWGFWKLTSPPDIQPGMLHFALVGFGGSMVQFMLSHGLGRTQILHLFADVCASIGVIIAALLIQRTGYSEWDGVVTMVIAVITAWAAHKCKTGGHHSHAGHDHAGHHHGYTHKH